MAKVSQATDQHHPHPHLGFLADPLSTILREAPAAATTMSILSVGQVQVQEIAAGPASLA